MADLRPILRGPATSHEGEFWNQRYRNEGAIWGEAPSPTAQILSRFLHANDHVLDVGCGYGRDLHFLIECGYRASGIDLSNTAIENAECRLRKHCCRAESLIFGQFEARLFPSGHFDALISHRLLHLLFDGEQTAQFVEEIWKALRPNGVVAVSARNFHDLDPLAMVEVGGGVYEYKHRPGHLIRYWNESAFRSVFGEMFSIESFTEAVEDESQRQPVPCHFTVMLGRKLDNANAPLGEGR